MRIDFANDELALIETLLAQEESETNIEIHHCRNVDYKQYLHQRLSAIREILQKITAAAAVATP